MGSESSEGSHEQPQALSARHAPEYRPCCRFQRRRPRVIPITGGTVRGRVTGTILNGGADYQLSGSLGVRHTLAPDNGELILVRNCGAGGLIPWFEAAVDGDFDFLNTQAYLSSGPNVGSGGVSITFYERN